MALCAIDNVIPTKSFISRFKQLHDSPELIQRMSEEFKTTNDHNEQIVLSGLLKLDKLLNTLPTNYKSLQAEHQYLFKQVNPAAGKERTANASKQLSQFELPERIAAEMTKFFNELKEKKYLAHLDKKTLCDECAHYFNIFNMVHPFTFGNGIMNRLFFSVLLYHAGHNVYWEQLNRQEYMDACNVAFHGEINDLGRLFEAIVM